LLSFFNFDSHHQLPNTCHWLAVCAGEGDLQCAWPAFECLKKNNQNQIHTHCRPCRTTTQTTREATVQEVNRNDRPIQLVRELLSQTSAPSWDIITDCQFNKEYANCHATTYNKC